MCEDTEQTYFTDRATLIGFEQLFDRLISFFHQGIDHKRALLLNVSWASGTGRALHKHPKGAAQGHHSTSLLDTCYREQKAHSSFLHGWCSTHLEGWPGYRQDMVIWCTHLDVCTF
jgi:hypothetical protein